MKLKFYFIGLGMGIIVTAVIMGIALGMKTEVMSDEEVIVRARQLGMVDASSRLNMIEEKSQDKDADDKKVVDKSEESQKDEGTFFVDKDSENDTENIKSSSDGFNDEKSTEKNSEDIEDTEILGKYSKITDKNDDIKKIPEEISKKNDSKSVTEETSNDADGDNSTETSKNTDIKKNTEETSENQDDDSESRGSVMVNIQDGLYSEGVSEFLESSGVIDDASAFNAFLVKSGRDRYIRPGAKLIPSGATYEEVAKIITGGK